MPCGRIPKRSPRPPNRPDIIMRCYDDKVREIHKDLKERAIFGKQLGYAESMEFQKWGGPHFQRVMATEIPSIPEVIEGYIYLRTFHRCR